MAERFISVWDAIIDDQGERESLKIKSTLMIKVEQYIKDHNLTQQQAADLMGVTQPKISTIVNGRLDKLTIDMLVNILAKVGVKISMSFSDEQENLGDAVVGRGEKGVKWSRKTKKRATAPGNVPLVE